MCSLVPWPCSSGSARPTDGEHTAYTQPGALAQGAVSVWYKRQQPPPPPRLRNQVKFSAARLMLPHCTCCKSYGARCTSCPHTGLAALNWHLVLGRIRMGRSLQRNLCPIQTEPSLFISSASLSLVPIPGYGDLLRLPVGCSKAW